MNKKFLVLGLTLCFGGHKDFAMKNEERPFEKKELKTSAESKFFFSFLHKKIRDENFIQQLKKNSAYYQILKKYFSTTTIEKTDFSSRDDSFSSLSEDLSSSSEDTSVERENKQKKRQKIVTKRFFIKNFSKYLQRNLYEVLRKAEAIREERKDFIIFFNDFIDNFKNIYIEVIKSNAKNKDKKFFVKNIYSQVKNFFNYIDKDVLNIDNKEDDVFCDNLSFDKFFLVEEKKIKKSLLSQEKETEKAYDSDENKGYFKKNYRDSEGDFGYSKNMFFSRKKKNLSSFFMKTNQKSLAEFLEREQIFLKLTDFKYTYMYNDGDVRTLFDNQFTFFKRNLKKYQEPTLSLFQYFMKSMANLSELLSSHSFCSYGYNKEITKFLKNHLLKRNLFLPIDILKHELRPFDDFSLLLPKNIHKKSQKIKLSDFLKAISSENEINYFGRNLKEMFFSLRKTVNKVKFEDVDEKFFDMLKLTEEKVNIYFPPMNKKYEDILKKILTSFESFSLFFYEEKNKNKWIHWINSLKFVDETKSFVDEKKSLL